LFAQFFLKHSAILAPRDAAGVRKPSIVKLFIAQCLHVKWLITFHSFGRHWWPL